MNYSRYPSPPRQVKHRCKLLPVLLILLVVLAAGGTYAWHKHDRSAVADGTTVAANMSDKQTASTQAASPAESAATACAGNSLNQNVIVSIAKRHMWACDGNRLAYNSPVVTGISYLAADLTPVGTYKIYAKETNQVLKGCDTTGCWDDPVSYWMPWLSNQYGVYGFHDATWRKPNDFGNISPDSPNASHGCVELPLATAAWLYNWAQVGTTVTVEA
ncbi:MAG TPA: L,D-transpeptidase [Candidatus Saccharimonadales bacterium]